MKIEIEVDDRLIPFFEGAAAMVKLTLAEYLAARVMWQEHSRVVKAIIPAPNEAQVAAATVLGTIACAKCHAPVLDTHECPVVDG